MTTEFDRALDEIQAAIDKAGPHLKLDAQQEALEALRAQVSNWRKIQDNVGAIRHEIINPVNTSLASGNKLSKWGLWVGIAGTTISVVLFAASNPFGTAKDITDIESRLSSLESMTRTALSQSSPELAKELMTAVEGEVEIPDNQTRVLLQDNNGREISIQFYTPDSDLIDGVRTLSAIFMVFESGVQVGGRRLAEITGLPPGDLFAGGSRFKVLQGETFALYGKRFQVTRVLSTSLLDRDGYADSKTAVYLREQ